MVKHRWQIQLGMVMPVALRGMARVSSCLLNKYGENSGEFKSVSSCRAGFLREAAARELCCPSDCALSITGLGLFGNLLSSPVFGIPCPWPEQHRFLRVATEKLWALGQHFPLQAGSAIAEVTLPLPVK